LRSASSRPKIRRGGIGEVIDRVRAACQRAARQCAADGAGHVSHAFVPHGGPALYSSMNTKSESSR
jgi:hypothetical protein